MSNSGLIGKEHNAHLNWLLNTWMSSNFPVCFLEGFPGTGKTTIARELMTQAIARKLTAVMITAPETEKDPTDDLLLDLAMELNSAGRDELAKAIENNRPLLDVLSTIVNDPILIIIDEFQRSMQGTRAITSGGFAKVLSTLANRKWLKGRILLLTNRLVERAKWSDPYDIRTLNGMSPDDGVELLEHFAQEGGRVDEIAPERRRDVVKCLGGNPRAIRLLVSNLAYESLDDLIGVQPELWEVRDREVSAELVEELERHLLEKTLDQLSKDYLLYLRRLSVHRKPFKREAIEHLFDGGSSYSQFTQEMIDRFLMEHHKGWYNLHSIVREIGLQKLAQSPASLQQAHSIAAQHYTRHFEAKQIVGWGALGGHFVEARYHLVKAGRSDDLKDIAIRFQSHIFSTLRGTSRVPHDSEELDERIAVLSALLETPGPKSLEYHLARLFQARNQRNDLRRALQHAQRARSDNDNAPWLLCAELLRQMERPEEAIAVLQEGIDRIPPDKNLVDLFTSYARLLTDLGRDNEALAVLKQGIDRIPPDKALVNLFSTHARLLTNLGRQEEALAVLKQGIDRIPPDKNLVFLYDNYVRLLVHIGRDDEALAVLKQGIDRIPPDKALANLFSTYARLLTNLGRQEEALAVLKQGIDRIPPDKALANLFSTYARLLADLGRDDEALAVLKQGIDRIPPTQGVSGLYYPYAKLLIFKNQVAKAIKILLESTNKIPPHQNQILIEMLLLLCTALRDEQGIAHFLQTTGRTQPELSALAQILLYQVQEHWKDAAEYAEQMRKSGIQYAALATAEAFAWLCAGQPERASKAISPYLKKELFFNHWLNAFIHLRLGNIEEAKQALTAYDPQIASLQTIDEELLLMLWDQPSSTWERFDLAYYFPTLPPALTGLPQPVTRITYHPPVLPPSLKTNPSSLIQPISKQPDSVKVSRSSRIEAVPEEYIDFDLHIDPNGSVLASSPQGQASGHIPITIPTTIRLSLQLIERRETDADLLKELGQALYDWLFPDPIHAHLQTTEAVIRRDKAKLRLRLRIEAEAIANLPLEFIYRAAGGYFLATNPDTVLSRYVNLSVPPERVRRRDDPLHMLAIIANPNGLPLLDPDEWESIIKDALVGPLDEKQGQMSLEVVKRATRKEIRNALLAQKPDIIQFIGHGTYQNGTGVLGLVDEDTAGTWFVDDVLFANLFMGYDDHLGLISIATVKDSPSDISQGLLGIARQLVKRSVPAVVAMQRKIDVKTAKVFLEDFYTSVAARKPIDWAVQSARNAISLEFGLDNGEFAIPILYMRAQDGEVF